MTMEKAQGSPEGVTVNWGNEGPAKAFELPLPPESLDCRDCRERPAHASWQKVMVWIHCCQFPRLSRWTVVTGVSVLHVHFGRKSWFGYIAATPA